MKGLAPDWMIPVGVSVVDGGAFPLTVNGKVDKKALPKVVIGGGGAGGAGAGEKVEPRNETERVIAGVFEAVSGAVGVGIDDEFFGIGEGCEPDSRADRSECASASCV